MPIYEYQGQQYDIDTTDRAEAKNKILAYLGTSTKVETPQPPPVEASTSEGLGAGFLNRALGLSRSLGGDVAESQIKSQEAADTYSKTNPMAVGLGGAGVDILAAAPGLVAAVPATAALGGGGLAAMGMEGLLGGTGTGMARGGERYQEVLTKTGSPEKAMQAALASGASGIVDVGLPASLGGSIGKRIVGGAGLNVLSGEADVAAQNAILADYKNLQRDQFDPTNMAINAVTGGVFGAAGSRTPFAKTGEPEAKVKNDAERTIDESFTGDSLVARQLDLLQTKRKFLEQDLTEMQQRATTSDLPVEDVILRQQKEAELDRVDADIEKLGGSTGKVVGTPREELPMAGKVAGETPPKTDVEAPRIDEQPQGATVVSREAGINPESDVPPHLQREDAELNGVRQEDVIEQTPWQKAESDFNGRISDLEDYRQQLEDLIADYHDNPNRNSPVDLADLETKLGDTESQLDRLYSGREKIVSDRVAAETSKEQPAITMEQRQIKAENIIAESIRNGATPEDTARRLSSVYYSAGNGVHYVGDAGNRSFISSIVSGLNKLTGQNDKLIVVHAPELHTGRYIAVGDNHVLFVSDVRKSNFAFLDAVPEAKRSQAAMIANIGHEYGHYFHVKLVQAFGHNAPVIKQLETAYNKYIESTNPAKVETVTATPLDKTRLGDSEYARLTDYYNKFPEYFAETFNRALLGGKLPENQFLRNLFLGLRKVTNAVYEQLSKLGINLSKEDFTSQFFTEYFQANRKFMEESGVSMIDNQIKMNLQQKLESGNKPILPSAQQINNDLESFYKMQGFNDFEPVNVVKVVQEQKKVRDIGWFSTKIAANMFGSPQLVNILSQSPVLRAVYQAVRNADTEASRIVKSLMEGTSSLAGWKEAVIKKGFITTLKKMQDVDSPAIAMQKLKNKDFAALEQVFRKGFDEGLDYPQALAKYGAELSEDQKHAFTVFADLFTKQYDEVVKLQQQMGKKNILPKRKGWYPAVRKGEYNIQLSMNGVPVYRQHVRTMAEAERLAKAVESSGKFKGLEVEFGKTNDTRIEAEQRDWLSTAIMQELQKRGETSGLQAVEEMLDKIYTRGGKLGKHHEQRMNVLGYKGTEIFGNVDERGLSFKDAIDSSVKEYSGSLRKMMISRNTDQILKTPEGLDQTHPNTMEVANLMRDMATSNVDSRLSSFDKMVNGTFDTIFQKIVGRESRLPVYERVSGLLTHLFYMMTLTMKPGFWIGQALTSPTSLRHILREANTMSALTSAGKGTFNLLRPSEDFMKCVYWLSQNTEVYHPQFANELTQFNMPKLLKEGTLASKVINTITGEIPSQAADSFSRYWTSAMMFEHYKSKGLKGKELYDAVAQATDVTMVQYSARNRAPYLKKLGIVGEAMAPLHTFSTAQWGNLVSDFKLAKDTGNVKPLIATFLTTIMLGGVIGAPMVAEYEIIRKALGLEDTLPSVVEWASSNNPRFLTHGVMSVSGFDLGSTMRWNPIVSGMVEANGTIADLFPAAKFIGKTTGNLATFVKAKAGGDVSEAEYRTAVLGLVPKGPVTGLVEDLKFGATDRAMVPTGGRGYGLVEQTDKERAASYLGTRTMESALESKQYGLETEQERKRSQDIQKQIDIATDALQKRNGEAYAKAVEKLTELGVRPESVQNQIKSTLMNRNRGLLERFALGAQGKGTSYDQQRKLQNVMEYYK